MCVIFSPIYAKSLVINRNKCYNTIQVDNLNETHNIILKLKSRLIVLAAIYANVLNKFINSVHNSINLKCNLII